MNIAETEISTVLEAQAPARQLAASLRETGRPNFILCFAAMIAF